MLLSIIIVSFNTSELTAQAIETAAADVHQSPLLQAQTEIIVIDNASTDASVEQLQLLAKKNSAIKLLLNFQNVGFSRANNQGILQAQGRFILLLNSDTIVQPQALSRLVSRFKVTTTNEQAAHSASHRGDLDRLGILSPLLLNSDFTVQPQGGSFPSLVSLSVHLLMLDDIPLIGHWLPSTQHTGRNSRSPQLSSGELIQQDWVGGTAMLIKREVLDEIGLLDEQIFMYGEDVEFCLRARKHHWDIAIDQAAQVVHFGSASSSSARAIEGELRGYLYLWSKHKPLWQLVWARSMIKLGCRLRQFVFGIIVHNPAKAQLYAQLATSL